MATIRKVGNSLGLLLPKDVCEKLDVREGDEIELEVEGSTLRVRSKAKDERPSSFRELVERRAEWAADGFEKSLADLKKKSRNRPTLDWK